MELPLNGFYYILFCNILLIGLPSTGQNRRYARECLKCDQAQPFSFFWKIQRSSPSPPSYFFGTIHAPYTKVWDYVPNKAKSAFRASKRIVFELDLMDSHTLISLSKCQLLPPGIKLIDVIPKDLYRRLKRHLDYIRFKIPLWITEEQKARGLYAETLYSAITMHWERKRPIWVMIMLNSLTENDIKSRGITVLDSFFYQKAKKLKKNIGSVENAEEQCVTLNYLNNTQVLFALNQTLLQHEGIRRGTKRSNHTTDEMIRHYNCGNLNEALFSEESAQIPVLKNHSFLTQPEEMEIAKKIEDYFRVEIILKRNKRMSERVLTLLTSNRNESFFFVFGAGHFLGNDSIIEQMKESGLQIIHINDTLRRQDTTCNNHKVAPAVAITSEEDGDEIKPASGYFLSSPSSINNAAHEEDGGSTIQAVSPSLLKSLVNSFVYSLDRRLPPQPYQQPQYYKPINVGHNLSPYSVDGKWPQQVPYHHQPYHRRASSHRLSLNDLLIRSYILNKNASSIGSQHHGGKLLPPLGSHSTPLLAAVWLITTTSICSLIHP